jgi:spore germination protein GerM
MATKATPTESKRERFVRLAQGRVNNALTAVSKVEHLANKTVYDYTEADVDRIETSLGEAVEQAVKSLRAGQRDAHAFSLEA